MIKPGHNLKALIRNALNLMVNTCTRTNTLSLYIRIVLDGRGRPRFSRRRAMPI